MKICFITVNYNNAELTREYVNSVFDLNLKKEHLIEIVIIDNNSPNNQEKEILDKLKKNNVQIIYNSYNSGYFSGLNIGLEYIKNKEFDYIIIGNNDVTYEKDFLIKLQKASYDNDTLVICPNIITKDGKHQNPMLKKKLTSLTKIITRLYFYNYFLTKLISNLKRKVTCSKNKKNLEWNKSGYIWIGIGACYILTKHFRSYIPRLDDRVFLWGEEALFANQIHEINKKVYYDSEIRVIHHESASVSLISSRKKYELVKNSYKIYKEYL